MTDKSSFEIFLSYRRDDSSGHAGRLHDALQARYGEDSVFMDVANIEPGLDFLEAIHRAIERCDVFLPIIGRTWLSSLDVRGRRRLDSPTDPVRLETEEALARARLRVIPILVDGATMPTGEDLPESLQRLATRNAHELSHTRWRYDVDQLISLLERIKEQTGKSPRVPDQIPVSRTSRQRIWSWDDYGTSPHTATKMRLVRALADQVNGMTNWAMTATTNQVAFRVGSKVIFSLQFWSRDQIRLAIPDFKGRPSPDPLPHLSGHLGKHGQWSWYLPADSRPLDIKGVLLLAARHAGVPGPTDDAAAVEASSSADGNLGLIFEEGMYAAYEHLKKNRGYKATYFLQLLRERGGIGAAQRLLQSGDHYSDGFLRLVELGELHHSVEAQVLRPQFRDLFTEQELSEARRRLKTADFEVDRWEEAPWT